MINVFPVLDILTLSGDIRDRSLKLYEIGPNFARFGPHFFGRGPPNFWTCIIKRTRLRSCGKFHGDRPRELGGSPVKEIKENFCSKTKFSLKEAWPR